MAKPGDGMRTVYLPKDTSDFQYYPIAKSSVGTETAGVRAKNNGNRPEGETRTLKATALAVAGNWVGP